MATVKCIDEVASPLWICISLLAPIRKESCWKHHLADLLFHYCISACSKPQYRRICVVIIWKKKKKKNSTGLYTYDIRYNSWRNDLMIQINPHKKINLSRALRATISACESLTMSPWGLKSERPIHFVPVPRATTSKSKIKQINYQSPALLLKIKYERKEKGNDL